MSNLSIKHHGIKGMKWGVRKKYRKGQSAKQVLKDILNSTTDPEELELAKELLKDLNHSDNITHHGVKGMKWGVRKAKDRLKDFSAKRNSIYDAIPDRGRKLSKLKSHRMTEDQLKTATQRLRLENDFKAQSQTFKNLRRPKVPQTIKTFNETVNNVYQTTNNARRLYKTGKDARDFMTDVVDKRKVRKK